MNNEKTKLVWSDDPKDKEKVESRKSSKISSPNDRVSTQEIEERKWTAVFRIEKGGRGGKTVTVIDQLPQQEQFVSELCKELKSKCGTGGKYEVSSQRAWIEIQGDKRVEIKAIFDKKNIRYKGM